MIEQKVSFYNLNRKLTDEEWAVLHSWCKNSENKALRWRGGDINPQNPNLKFIAYSKRQVNGEEWRRIENPHILKENTPSLDGKVSYYFVNRRLTDEEWLNLKMFQKETPHLRWRQWDTRKDNPDLVFAGYNRYSKNGEQWRPRKDYEEQLERANVARSTNEKKKVYAEKRRQPEKRAKQKENQRKWNDKQTVEDKKEYYRKRYQKIKTRPLERYSMLVRRNIVWAMKGLKGEKRTEEILGCTFQEFRDYIESKFEPWMNWGNHGSVNGKPPTGPMQCHDLDHIVPVSTAKTEEELVKLNHYTNFQPLCSYINRYVKKDRLDYTP